MSDRINVKYWFAGCCIWTLVIISLLYWDFQQKKSFVINIAQKVAFASYQQYLIYHIWDSNKGELYYLTKGDDSPESSGIKDSEQQLTTSSGDILTLVKSTEMINNLPQLLTKPYKIDERLISLKPFGKENLPDEWETKALRSFEQGVKNASIIEEKSGTTVYRMVNPLVVEKTCLKCHGDQGYKLGDIRGGLSVSIPIDPLWGIITEHKIYMYVMPCLIWLIGLILFSWFWRLLRKKVNALQDAGKFVQTVIDGIAEPIMVIDCKNYKLILANECARKSTSQNDLLTSSKTCYQISHNRNTPCDANNEPCPILEVKETKAPVKITHTHVSSANEKSIISIVATPIFDHNGEVIQIIESCHDITQEMALENQLSQSQKMEAIGLLAGGIAHDFNNILTGILGYTDMLKKGDRSKEQVLQAALTIEKATERAALLTSQLLGFARRGKLQNVPINIHQIIQEVIQFLNITLEKNINIKLDLQAEYPYIIGDPSQMEQIILNLAINSRDAMPNGGELTFATEVVPFKEKRPGIKSDINSEKTLLITVTDNGCGIPQDILDRIYEPFFSTKEQGKGTGMGLAMVYGIVKDHHGVIQVTSEIDQGTSFKISLPLTNKTEVPLPKKIATSPKTYKGNEGILLVDDEVIIRKVVSDMLIDLGYQVTTRANGHEAVNFYQENYSKIDLVIIDLSMPKMDGRECFKKLKEINPSIKAVIATGYGVTEIAQELRDEGILDIIQKPYNKKIISSKLRNLLDKPTV